MEKRQHNNDPCASLPKHCVQGHHFGSLKLAVLGIFTPQKLANMTNQGSPHPEPGVKPFPAHHWQKECARRYSLKQNVGWATNHAQANWEEQGSVGPLEWQARVAWVTGSYSRSLCPYLFLHILRSQRWSEVSASFHCKAATLQELARNLSPWVTDN